MQRTALRRTLPVVVAALLAVLGAAVAASGRPRDPMTRATAPDFRLAPVRGVTFTGPVWAGAAPGSGATWYVAEQRGLVWAVTGRRKVRFLDVRDQVLVSGEQGLLSVAFARDYARTGRFFVYLVARDGDGRVLLYRARNGRVLAGSRRLVLRVPLSPPEATNHNGGNLWTTVDGNLWLGVGDGGGGGVERRNSQRLGVLMGKLLRITPRANGGYVVPRSNPFVRRAGARHEIYALGLRNPWRWSIDEPTGDIWIGDVGQGAHEEVDRLVAGRPAGANFGWPRMEGTSLFSGAVRLAAGTRAVRPIATYPHTDGRCSITGGVVYHGPVAAMRGRYLYADFCSDRIWSMRPGGATRAHRGVGGIVHFGTLTGGGVVVLSATTGRAYRVVAR